MRCKSVNVIPLVVAVLLGRACFGQPIHLTIDASRRFQTIQGFGACLFLGAQQPYDEAWYQDLYARDLGCSIVRMELTPWVLGRDVTRPVRLGDDLEANVRMMDFSAAGGVSAARFIRAVEKKKLDRMLLVGSLWTPPHWMKDGAAINFVNNSSGGHLKMDADNLEQFGRYVAAYVKGFARVCGEPFYAISLQNELMFKEPYNSCQYEPDEYHAAVRAVGRAFVRYGITTKIMGPEGVAPNGDFFNGKQLAWINAVEDDPETAKYLSFFCGHGSGQSEDDVQDYWAKIKGFGKESWVSEWSGEDPQWIHVDKDGKPDGALAMAWHLYQMLADGNNSAALYWQCCDGKSDLSGQNLMGTTPDSAESSTKFAVAKQFFRYVRPGAVRVAVTPEVAGLGAVAFVRDSDHAMTVVLVNGAANDKDVDIALPAAPAVARFQEFRTSAADRFVALPDPRPASGHVTITVPAEAVVTLYGQ